MNEPAFPTVPVNHGYDPAAAGFGTGSGPGMTLRDYFAAKAMAAICDYIPNGPTSDSQAIMHAARIANHAYLFADQMLYRRDQGDMP